MVRHGQALPQATTESAKEARKAFFCELCNKGYARQNEFDAHEGSYDHQHRKRLKDLRTLTRDPTAASKARAAENEAAGLKSIDLAASATTSGAPKKKPVFKSTLQPHNAGAVNVTPAVMLSGSGGVPDDEDPTGMVRNGFLEGGEDGGEMYVPEGVVGEECGGEGCWICRCKGKVGGGPKA